MQERKNTGGNGEVEMPDAERDQQLREDDSETAEQLLKYDEDVNKPASEE